MGTWAKLSAAAPITLHDAVSSPLAIPSGSGGGDISVARDTTGYAPVDGEIAVYADDATDLDPLALYGERDDGTVAFLGEINRGDPIRIPAAGIGFSQIFTGVGIFKRLQIGGYAADATWTGGAKVTVTYRPLLVTSKAIG